jgi:hypothetical protein
MTMVQLMFVKNTIQYKSLKSDFDSLIMNQQESTAYNIYAQPWENTLYNILDQYGFDQYGSSGEILNVNESRLHRFTM